MGPCAQPHSVSLGQVLGAAGAAALLLLGSRGAGRERDGGEGEQPRQPLYPSCPQLPAERSAAQVGSKEGGQEGQWALFHGDRVSGEQLCCCYHFAAPFSLPLEATVQSAHATISLLLWCRTDVFEVAQTQVPLWTVEISYELCAIVARHVLVSRWVWKTICSSAVMMTS